MNASIEPELLSPPPRRIRRRGGIRFQNGCIQLFILPHTVVGIGVLAMALLHILVLTLGVRVPATVTKLDTSRGSKGSITYKASFNYRLNGQNYSANRQVSADEHGRARVGQTVSVKVLPFFPGAGEVLFMPGGKSWGTGLWLLPFALFWNGILSVFYFALYGGPWKERKLIRSGTPVLGRVTEKNVIRGKSTSYVVHYEYLPSEFVAPVPGSSPWGVQQALPTAVMPAPDPTAGFTPIRGKMTVPHDEYNALNVGNEVTVLYDPRKPKRSILYAAAGYRAIR